MATVTVIGLAKQEFPVVTPPGETQFDVLPVSAKLFSVPSLPTASLSVTVPALFAEAAP